MKEKTYKLTFLPLFEGDLNEVVDYISLKLKNPSAAHRLVDDVEQAILKRLDSPSFSHLMRQPKTESIHTTELT